MDGSSFSWWDVLSWSYRFHGLPEFQLLPSPEISGPSSARREMAEAIESQAGRLPSLACEFHDASHALGMMKSTLINLQADLRPLGPMLALSWLGRVQAFLSMAHPEANGIPRPIPLDQRIGREDAIDALREMIRFLTELTRAAEPQLRGDLRADTEIPKKVQNNLPTAEVSEFDEYLRENCGPGTSQKIQALNYFDGNEADANAMLRRWRWWRQRMSPRGDSPVTTT